MPIFFCENCGKEVSPEESTCPFCARQFTAVRCPKCGFEGEIEDFASGCPGCGYLKAVETRARVPVVRDGRSRIELPPLFYWISGAALIALLVGLLVFLLLRT